MTRGFAAFISLFRHFIIGFYGIQQEKFHETIIKIILIALLCYFISRFLVFCVYNSQYSSSLSISFRSDGRVVSEIERFLRGRL